jgi:hypothetical protein
MNVQSGMMSAANPPPSTEEAHGLEQNEPPQDSQGEMEGGHDSHQPALSAQQRDDRHRCGIDGIEHSRLSVREQRLAQILV